MEGRSNAPAQAGLYPFEHHQTCIPTPISPPHIKTSRHILHSTYYPKTLSPQPDTSPASASASPSRQCDLFSCFILFPLRRDVPSLTTSSRRNSSNSTCWFDWFDNSAVDLYVLLELVVGLECLRTIMEHYGSRREEMTNWLGRRFCVAERKEDLARMVLPEGRRCTCRCGTCVDRHTKCSAGRGGQQLDWRTRRWFCWYLR